MYLLNSTPISADAQFESNGILYPAGWIRSATEAERIAAGIVWHDDQPRPDDFYQYVYPDPAHPWQWLSTPYTPAEMKPRLKDYSRQAREHRELAGVTHTVLGKSRLIPTDPATRAVFFDYRVVIARPGPTPPTNYDFKGDAGGEVVTVPEAQVLAIEQKMEDRISGCADVQLTLQAQIEAGTITTKVQIDAAYLAVP